ncbi:MAG TPA: hypothetical protein DCG75_06810 [Bacteroidales bacterium]|nr:hypothetical protein [Bacteroidales bacterium]
MENETSQIQNPQPLPNATAVLVLGILSIVTCWCIGIPGLVMGIIAIVLSGKSKTLYNENPANYSEASYKNLNAGRVCAIIGTVLSSIYLSFALIKWIIVGGAILALFSELPWESL